jgi:cytoskeleton protein RodZ
MTVTMIEAAIEGQPVSGIADARLDDEGLAMLVCKKPGDMLRVARETKGLSQTAVSEALHLTVHYVKSLENDDYAKLPGLTFVKGYFRAYARYLRMDVEEVMACYEEYLKQSGNLSAASEQQFRIRKRGDQALLWAVMSGVVLIVALATGWWFFGREQAAVTTTALVQTAPMAIAQLQTPALRLEPVAEPEPLIEVALVEEGDVAAGIIDLEALDESGETEATEIDADKASIFVRNADGSRFIELYGEGDDLLELNFSGESWLQVEDADHVSLHADLMRSGDVLLVHGQAPFHVLFGDGSQVELLLNEAPIDISGVIRYDNTARLQVEGTNAIQWEAY